eukprot:TRINITY_DN12961_c0_g1_i1.p1 TRINITY_DN12961_c0_g1~~TRINITY_DN12961_c0_g1_i1.p1  ORF type:complete len:146 (+),score=23.17 TRINITY_DN12961_c0_g1_i1:42-440(+)
MAEPLLFNCEDFTDFKNALMKIRKVDDNIIFQLNRTDVRDQDKEDCSTVWQKLSAAHKERDVAIKNCLNRNMNKLMDLESKAQKASDDTTLKKELTQTRNTLNMLSSELDVEQIIVSRSNNLYKKKCRNFII